MGTQSQRRGSLERRDSLAAIALGFAPKTAGLQIQLPSPIWTAAVSKKIAEMAETRSAQIAPHLCCGPIVAAAKIQIATCTANFLILESIGTFVGPYMNAVKGTIAWGNGYTIPPTAPEVGLEPDAAAIADMPYNGTDLHLEMTQYPITP